MMSTRVGPSIGKKFEDDIMRRRRLERRWKDELREKRAIRRRGRQQSGKIVMQQVTEFGQRCKKREGGEENLKEERWTRREGEKEERRRR